MSEEAAAPALEAAPAVVPAVESAVAAPAAEPAAPAEVLVETAPEVAEAAAESETPAETAEEAKPEAEAAAEPSPEAEAEAAPAEAEAPQPQYADWTLPEGMSIDTPHLSALNDVFGKHGLSQEAAQEIVDRGAFILKDAQEKMAQAQHDAFADTRRNWIKDFETKAGNRRNTVLNDARSGIRDLVPDEKARTDLWSALSLTGAGDHPALIYAFAAHGKRMRERAAPSPGIPADPKRGNSAADRRYGRTS